jgi:hypothetical protein
MTGVHNINARATSGPSSVQAPWRRSRKMPISFDMHVRIFKCNNEAPTGLIIVKFGAGDFHENLWRNSKFGENRTTRPKYVYIFDSCMKYFVAREQCKGNPLFHVREKTNNFILLTAKCRLVTHCCVLVAINITRTPQNFTLYVLCFSCSSFMMVY